MNSQSQAEQNLPTFENTSDFSQKRRSHKRKKIAIILTFLLLTILVATQVYKKLSKVTYKGRVENQLISSYPEFFVHPDAKISFSAEAEVSNKEETGYVAQWKIENKSMDEIAAWYTGVVSEDDDEKEYEITELPETYELDQFTVVVKENGKLLNMNFTKDGENVLVKVTYPSDYEKN